MNLQFRSTHNAHVQHTGSYNKATDVNDITFIYIMQSSEMTFEHYICMEQATNQIMNTHHHQADDHHFSS